MEQWYVPQCQRAPATRICVDPRGTIDTDTGCKCTSVYKKRTRELEVDGFIDYRVSHARVFYTIMEHASVQ